MNQLNSTKDRSWRFFSMPDYCIVAICATVCLVAVMLQKDASPDNPWGVRRGIIEKTVLLIISTAVSSGVPILFSQWKLKKRNARLSGGELLWLCQSALWGIVLLASVIGDSFLVSLLFFVTQAALSSAAFVRLLLGLLRELPPVPCKWTDLVGTVTCVAAAVFIFLNLFVLHPPVI
jgi:hypothetical protein